MAVRTDKIQVSIAFVTDESKAYAKLIEDNKKFLDDIKKAQKEGKDLASVVGDIAKRGEAVGNINLQAVAPAQLLQRAKQLEQVLKLIPQSAPEYKQLETEYKAINNQLATMRQRTKGVSEQMNETRESAISTFGKGAAIFAAISAVGFKLAEVSDEAAKMRASLRRALGGDDLKTTQVKAQLTELANDLGISIDTVVEQFASLQNRGFNPTIAGFKTLVDIAAFSKKPVDQLTEAILDAQTGEFERLKEFGIKASKEGNNVSLSFGSMTKTVALSGEGIKSFFNELGQDARVMGAAAESAKGFSGAIARIGNAVSSFLGNQSGLNTVASNIANSLADVVEGLGEMIAPTKKASDNVADLQVQFNLEVGALKNANLTQENRKRLIDTINSKYKDYLPKLLTEKSSIQEIEIAQKAANKAFEQKITLLAAEESFVDIQKRLLKAKQAEITLAVDVERKQKDIQDLEARRGKANTEAAIQVRGEFAKAYLDSQANLSANQQEQKALQDEFERTRLAAEKLGLDISKIGQIDAPKSEKDKSKVDVEKLLKAELERIQAQYDKRELQAAKDKRDGAIDNEKDYQTTLLQLRQESLEKQIAVYQKYGRLESGESIKLQREKLELIIDGEKKLLDLQLSETEQASEKLKLALLERYSKGEINETDYNFKLNVITRAGIDKKLQILQDAGQSETNEALKLKEELLNINKELREQIAKDATPVAKLSAPSVSKTLPKLQLRDEEELIYLKQMLAAGLVSREEYERRSREIQINGIQNRLFNLKIEGNGSTDEYKKLYNELLDLQAQFHEKEIEADKAAADKKKDLQNQGLQELYGSGQQLVQDFLTQKANAIQSESDKEIESIDKRIAVLAKDEDARRRNAATVFELERQKLALQEQTSARIKKLKRGEIIVEGLIEIAKIWATYASLPFLAVGLTAVSAARTGLALKTVDSSFYKGGRTGNKQLFRDKEGKSVVGVVHENEWVAPEWQTTHPHYAPIINYLEQGRMKGYAQGGYVNTTPTSSALSVSTSSASDAALSQMTAALSKLENMELTAKVVYSEFETVRDTVDSTRSDAAY